MKEDENRGLSTIGRAATVGALLLALVVVGWVLLGAGDGYEVRARFQAATQIVKGNLVQVAGRRVGTVEAIELTEDGQAELRLKIEEPAYQPLRAGTQATLKVASLSGVANRYVDLRIPGAGTRGTIPEGGLIPQSDTTSAVDLDQLFNTFDDETKKGLQDFIRGSARMYDGAGDEANAGWEYLNPSLVAASRLFRELDHDTPALERFLVETSGLVTDLADRRDDLSTLVDRLATTTGAIAREEQSLSTAISELPPFMRRANSTFVDLRATLDDLDPLVEESKPVVRPLRQVLAELKGFARGARPTIRDLATLVKKPGADNDLIELNKAVPPFRDVAVRPVRRNGKERPGSFPTSTESLRRQQTPFAFFRPYLVDFTGWLDDFSHSGIYDANGSASRVATSANIFATVDGTLKLVPPELRDEVTGALTARGQINRCPGATERPAEDGSNPWRPTPDFNCDPSQTPPGN